MHFFDSSTDHLSILIFQTKQKTFFSDDSIIKCVNPGFNWRPNPDPEDFRRVELDSYCPQELYLITPGYPDNYPIKVRSHRTQVICQWLVVASGQDKRIRFEIMDYEVVSFFTRFTSKMVTYTFLPYQGPDQNTWMTFIDNNQTARYPYILGSPEATSRQGHRGYIRTPNWQEVGNLTSRGQEVWVRTMIYEALNEAASRERRGMKIKMWETEADEE